jgi:hypothetical protein
MPTPATHPQVQYRRQTQREQSAASPLVALFHTEESELRQVHTPLQSYRYIYLKTPPALAISVLGSCTCMYVRELVHTTTCALCVFTRPCPASCSYYTEAMQRRCMPPAHLHPRHPTSRITQLHLASRGISPIRAARLALRALPWPTRPPAALWHLVQGLGICLLLSLPDHCTCRTSPSQHRIARFTTNAEDSCEPNAISPPETLSVSARCWVYHPQHIERSRLARQRKVPSYINVRATPKRPADLQQRKKVQ